MDAGDFLSPFTSFLSLTLVDAAALTQSMLC